MFVMGTEASAANLLDESQLGAAASSGKLAYPWCFVISKLPKPTKVSILPYQRCVNFFRKLPSKWNNFARFMGLKGSDQLPSFRPFILDLAYTYIESNFALISNTEDPLVFFEGMILRIKKQTFL